MRYCLAFVMITALALGACSGGDDAAACTFDAEGKIGYRWGWTAGLIFVHSNTIVDFDRTDPIQSYRPGYADGFVTGVGRWHAGLAATSTEGDFLDSLGYQRGFRDGQIDGYIDPLKSAPSSPPSADYSDGYFAGFGDGLQNKDSACSN
jgi:hypothetical protein